MPDGNKRSSTFCVLHVAAKIFFWLVTFIHTYTYTHAHTHTHTHGHTHTHTHTHTHSQTHTDTHVYTHKYTYTHTDLNFAIFWKDREIKYTILNTMVVCKI